MEAAERLKISAENLNSMLSTSLKKISDTKKMPLEILDGLIKPKPKPQQKI